MERARARSITGSWCCVLLRSEGLDRAGLQALRTLGRLELHPLTLGQLAVALDLDLALVDEQVLATILRGDEAEALGCVEPLDGSGCHVDFLVSPQERCGR